MSEQSQTSFIFINSNDPMMPSQVINDAQPFIKLPFPPVIDPRDLITLNPDGREPSRAPNAFIIYRKLFIKTAKDEGYSLPMSIISSMASKSWEQESEVVKNEYKRIAKEAYLYRNEICPKPKRERKKKQWSIISFSKSSNKPSGNIKSPKSFNGDLQSPVPTLSPTPENNTTFTEIADNSPILNLDLFADWENFLYPSPDLSTYTDSEISTPEINEYNFNLEINSPLQVLDNFYSPILTEEQQFIDNLINSPIQTEQQFIDSLINSPIQTEEQLLIDALVNIKDAPLTTILDNQLGLGISNTEYLNIPDISSPNDFYNNQLTSSNFLDTTSALMDFNDSYYF
ncbi:9262_t:CDS:1 [Acaulospora morrowiae]|uniref:9262_t:CDS:1 n=1 Tax=Acaulospora morrowiae TaxID=94023 RepID=A0A9N9BBT4_9GLOM|nr:9262_t:CDS:1 [Acaulospora morrowiae]